jgi:adenine-specific DNA-methyltransferase
VDFEQLRQELSGMLVEGPQERYQLNWPGKREALLTANSPIAKTLRPCRDESEDFEGTKNLFIEGDNLDALKLLQEAYLGTVKLIYIDPPYNTGKDFIYRDDFATTRDEYFRRSNQRDEQGNRLALNSESNGRLHSDWLSMMYSRLRLARNLLSEDGAIFISINHKELANLRRLTDEIFGEDNLLCIFAWRTDGNFDNQAKFKYCHEYIVAYAKSEAAFPIPLVVDPSTPTDSKLFRPEIRNTIVKNGPKNPPSEVTLPAGFPASVECCVINARSDSWPQLRDDVEVSNGKTVRPVRAYSGWSSRDLLDQFIQNQCKEVSDGKGQSTTFELTPTGAIEAVKTRGEPSHVISVLTGFGGPQSATADLAALRIPFDDYPKPVGLIKYIASMIRGSDFVALDFFAGSATTAEAILQLNASDGGSRRFLLVQLPESCDPGTDAYKAGFKTIAEIAKERVRRAGKRLRRTSPATDVGFRVLKVDTSNMSDVYYAPDSINQGALEGFADNIKPDRAAEDLLFQSMLDWGVDLALPITRQTIQGREVLFVDGNALAACFDAGGRIDETFAKDLATHKPLRVVFRDAGFPDSAAKINVEQIFKLLSPATEVKCI